MITKEAKNEITVYPRKSQLLIFRKPKRMRGRYSDYSPKISKPSNVHMPWQSVSASQDRHNLLCRQLCDSACYLGLCMCSGFKLIPCQNRNIIFTLLLHLTVLPSEMGFIPGCSPRRSEDRKAKQRTGHGTRPRMRWLRLFTV